MRLLFAMLFAVILGGAAFGQTATPIVDGAYGGACRSGDNQCDMGVCDRALDICVSCGMEGAPACIGYGGQPVCTFPNYGYRPVSLGGRQLYCFTRETEDCGHVGLPACNYGADPVCNFGVPVVAADGKASCMACGDYGQPCCPDASCDYGTCQGNVCLPDKQRGSALQGGASAAPPAAGGSDKAAILAAIADCRLTEARSLHAGADPGAPWYDEVTRTLIDGIERENEVRALYDRALAKQAEARRLVTEGDDEALLAFQATEDLLRDAQALSRCKATIDVIAQAIAINGRNGASTRAIAKVALAETDIRQCNFSVAQELLEGIPPDTPGRDAALNRLKEARNREAQVERMYDAARNLHRLADQRVLAGQPEQALEMLQDARQGLVNARQLTECSDYRDRITDALRVVGGSLELTEDLAEARGADRMPQRYEAPGASASVDPGQPVAGKPHPCHDASVPVDATASFYSQYFGGGHESYLIKGQYLCDTPYVDTPFAILSGGAMTLYACAREGDHYVDCRVSETITFTDTRPEGKGTSYIWGKEGAWRWMIVVDR